MAFKDGSPVNGLYPLAMLHSGMADKENKLGQTQRKLQGANTFAQNRMCTEMGTLPGPHSLVSGRKDAKHPHVTVRTSPPKGGLVCVVVFFNKRMKHRGGGRKVNGLLQLDYAVCGANALQTGMG